MRSHRSIAKLVQRLGRMAARTFKLGLKEIRINEAMREYGNCDENGNIEIRLTRLRGHKILNRLTIIDTLAHELAHLGEWPHGKEHKALTGAIKIWLKRRWN